MASNPRRSNGSRRDKIRAQVLAEESDCALCGSPVDKSLTMDWGKHGPRCKGDGCPGCTPHPMRAEVDEIIPVSLGGSPTDRSNTRLTHRLCNQKRGNGTRPQPMAVDAFPISNCWAGMFDTIAGVGSSPQGDR